ncbi:exopolysaccharide transport family protein [Foetidibacter luteolus]|uniref:exopolysaccharide transport family protein n=1 Tax=Foetidibacter luteolus TaxID=2608880 RepID=UPI00129B3673|nr:Wzz/FepE/Etk N-terminal domain-containing protein [Foetidibacter luteolus]
MEILYLFNALWRKKWIILLCTVAAIVSAYVFTMNLKPVYKSSAQIATGFTTSEAIKMSEENLNFTQIDIKFNNVIENFTSPKVVQLLSYNLILHDLTNKTKPFTVLTEDDKKAAVYEEIDLAKAAKAYQDKLNKLEPLNPDVPEDLQLMDFLEIYGYDVKSLTGNLYVYRLAKTDYINLEMKSHNPDLSAFAVNTLISELNRYYVGIKVSNTGVSIASLDSTVRQKKALLDQKLNAKSNYLSSHNIIDVGVDGGSKLSQESTYESQLTEERARQTNLNFVVTQLDNLIKEARSKGQSSVSSAKVYFADNSQYLVLKKQYNDLNAQYVAKGSNDADLKRRMDDLQERMKRLDVTTGAGATQEGATVSIDDLVQKKLFADADLKASTQRIGLYETKLRQLRASLGSIATSGADIQKLEQEITLAQTEYTAANNKLNSMLALAEGFSAFNQTLFGQPKFEPEPSKRMAIVALAGIGALFLSILVIALLEYLDQSIKTPSQFLRQVNLPLLGTINYVEKIKGNVFEQMNYVDHDERNRHNVFRELLRKLRFEIENSGKRIFLFTSTEPGQGKTMLIQALSYSLSLGKKRVLIIDTNFCNNDLTALLAANPVLEKFQMNGKPFSVEDIKPLITKTKMDGVDSIGCGYGDYTPSEILPKNHLLNYLDQLLPVYDFIFFEGAPLNSYTDTKELLKYSDGMIAVFSSDAIIKATDKESIKFLRQYSNKFIGAILNKVQTNDLDL